MDRNDIAALMLKPHLCFKSFIMQKLSYLFITANGPLNRISRYYVNKIIGMPVPALGLLEIQT